MDERLTVGKAIPVTGPNSIPQITDPKSLDMQLQQIEAIKSMEIKLERIKKLLLEILRKQKDSDT